MPSAVETGAPPTALGAAPLPEVLTPREAAEFLRIHPRTLERKVAAGELPAPYRSGRLVRYSRTALQEFVAAGT